MRPEFTGHLGVTRQAKRGLARDVPVETPRGCACNAGQQNQKDDGEERNSPSTVMDGRRWIRRSWSICGTVVDFI